MTEHAVPITYDRYGRIYIGTVFPGRTEASATLDTANAPAFGEALDRFIAAHPGGCLLLNLHHVYLMTSAALTQLVRASTALANTGGGLRVCAPSGPVAQVLEVTALDQLFAPMANVREAAEAYVADIENG